MMTGTTENPKKNSEGYYDMTAYEAVKTTDVNPQRGEIWQMYTDKKMLVIQTGFKRHVVLTLMPDERGNRICVGGDMYTNPMLVSYAYYTSFAKLVKKLDDDEFREVCDAVKHALGFAEERKEEPKPVEPPQEDKLKEMGTTISNQRVAIARYQAERDVYKNLYMDLVKVMTGDSK